MTADTAPGHCPHSHPKTTDTEAMRIPKRLNTFLDQHGRAFVYVGVFGVALLLVQFLPAQAFGLAAVGVGGWAGWYGRSPQVRRLREQRDAADRECGRLAERLREAVRGRVAEDALQTRFMPRIGPAVADGQEADR